MTREKNAPTCSALPALQEDRSLVQTESEHRDRLRHASADERIAYLEYALRAKEAELARIQDAVAAERTHRAELYESAPVGYSSIAPNGAILKINRVGAQILNLSQPELTSRGLETCLSPDSVPAFSTFLSGVFHTGNRGFCELKLATLRICPVTGPCPAFVQIEASLDPSGRFCHAILIDISERKWSELALQESEYRWKFALEGAGDGVWDWNVVTNAVIYSKRWKEMYGFSEDEISNQASEWSSRIHPDDFARVMTDVENYLKGATPTYSTELRMRCKDGSWKWILTRGMVVSRDADGRPLRMIGTNTDISEQKQVQEELKITALVYQAIGDAIMVIDAAGNVVAINPAFSELTGYTIQDFAGKEAFSVVSAANGREFYETMSRSLEVTGRWQGEILSKRKSGEVCTEWLVINTIYDDKGGVLRRVAMFSDMTAQKRAEETIWRQANYDALTALPNRRLFYDRLAQEIKKAQRSGCMVALLFIDLDQFKEVNDTLGHQVGDALLEEAGRRISKCVRDEDTVARIGGDEFTIILGGLAPDENVTPIAQRVIKTLSEAFLLGDETVYLSASIGITFYPTEAADVDTLIKNADQAMYAAKKGGRNRYQCFTMSLQEVATWRQILIKDLRNALDNCQFSVHFQPVVEMATGRIAKAEALLRWNHPIHGLVGPAHFIPLAEETGLINNIGEWVFKESARWAKRWMALTSGQFKVSVNVSPVQFHSNHRFDWLEYLDEIGLPGENIIIEITEGLLLNATPEIQEKLRAFREGGIRIAIDDFGTGYSALSYLKKFEIDYLKIDRSFISNLVTDISDKALTEAIIGMAHKLGLQVIAEGVETAGQKALLSAAKCDYSQGYFFSTPITPEALEDLLKKNFIYD